MDKWTEDLIELARAISEERYDQETAKLKIDIQYHLKERGTLSDSPTPPLTEQSSRKEDDDE